VPIGHLKQELAVNNKFLMITKIKTIAIPKFSKSPSFYFSLLSGICLILAYPKFDLGFLAWIAFVPLFFALDADARGITPGRAFRIAYGCGFIFFAGTLFWIGCVTYLGTFLLITYFALFFGIFGVCYAFSRRLKPLVRLLFLPACWAFLEFLRAHLFSGFDWVCLGHSQYRYYPLIQIADITGVFGVSFVVMMNNVAIKEVYPVKNNGRPSPFEESPSVRLDVALRAFIVFSAVMIYGFLQLAMRPELPTKKVTIVQPDINQDVKWVERMWPSIVDKIFTLTKAGARQKPDLIIWPETSLPGIFQHIPQGLSRGNSLRSPSVAVNGYTDENGYFRELTKTMKAVKIPLVFGIVTQEADDIYFNSAILLNARAQIAGVYHKIHLVPFGEFIPLRKIFPFLKAVVPIEDFRAGRLFTVLPFPGDPSAGGFSVLICFEDSVADVARGFVRNGAGFLVNITNDAWFGDTKAPFLHLQSAVFRAVENRRMLVRCANTGVSAFIDRYGRVRKEFGDAIHKLTYVAGYTSWDVPFETSRTIYNRCGDLFAYICGAYVLFTVLQRKKSVISSRSW
jgi:apolipoprotein N-acyltransferase